MDTWSHGTKQSQTKPILTDLPLPAQQKTSLTFLLTKTYTTTPQSQKQSQTNPISPPATKDLTNQAQMRHYVFGTKGYDTPSGAAETVCNNVRRRRLKSSAIIRTRAGSPAALAPSLCRLNNNRDQLACKNHSLNQKPPAAPKCTASMNPVILFS